MLVVQILSLLVLAVYLIMWGIKLLGDWRRDTVGAVFLILLMIVVTVAGNSLYLDVARRLGT